MYDSDALFPVAYVSVQCMKFAYEYLFVSTIF